MNFQELELPGCFAVDPVVRRDQRGGFVKTFHAGLFAAHGLRADWQEAYHTVSRRGVLRGLHFQTPPHDHVKLVYCACGRILDAVVDLRRGSPGYGRFALRELSARNGRILYLPSGIAHGFYTLSARAVVMYQVSSMHSPEHDAGVRWNSVGIPWPNEAPVLSERDRNLPPFAEFISPFCWEALA